MVQIEVRESVVAAHPSVTLLLPTNFHFRNALTEDPNISNQCASLGTPHR
jgi:hypothetical protein